MLLITEETSFPLAKSQCGWAVAEQHLERRPNKVIILPKKPNYDLPEGRYRAFLRDVFELRQPGKGRVEQACRFVFQIVSLTHPRYTYLAGKNYRLADATKLAHDLETWLGDELDKLVDQNGALSIERLETLQRREADIEVVHIDNDSYDKAYRHIQRLLPPGTLVDDRQPPRAAA